MLQLKNLSGAKNYLSLLHLNIRSHHGNLDSLITLLKNVELKFSFIGISANNFATFTNRLAK